MLSCELLPSLIATALTLPMAPGTAQIEYTENTYIRGTLPLLIKTSGDFFSLTGGNFTSSLSNGISQSIHNEPSWSQEKISQKGTIYQLSLTDISD